jgi:uncharacterized protein (DUF58 family)
MPAEDHTFVKRAVIYARMWFSDMGRILCAIVFIGGMIASPGLHIDAFLLPTFILAVFFTAYLFAYANRPRLSARRVLPAPCRAGEHLVYEVVVTNKGRVPLRHLKVSEGVLPYGLYDAPDHSAYRGTIDWLPPGATATVKLVIRCKYRDVYDITYLLAGTCFPSGILRFPVRIPARDKVTVYPRFFTQREFHVPFQRVYQPGGIAISSNVGDSNEFFSTREYRQGDRLKDIHWASYARTGELIVKQYVDEYFIRIGILLDTEHASIWQKDDAVFERRIAAAAGIADALVEKDYVIDLFAAGRTLHHFQMGRALAHIDNLLEYLAGVEACPRVAFAGMARQMAAHLRQLSALVVLLGDWDERRQGLCDAIAGEGIPVRVVVFKDKPLARPLDGAATRVTSKDELIK